MTNKLTIAALLSVLSVPAFANEYNAGHVMQAKLLNLDVAEFTVNELARIAAEDNGADRDARIAQIRAAKQ